MRKTTTKAQRWGLAVVAALAASTLALSGCGSSGGGDAGSSGDTSTGDEQSITFWTMHATPQRLAIQEQVAADFKAKTGIDVEVVGVNIDDMNQALVGAAASGDLPDVIMLSTDQVAAWAAQGALDAEAAQAVVDTLGESTISEKALNYAKVDGALQAVPSDGWGEMLYYRADILQANGIDEPQTLQDVTAAAEKLKAAGAPGLVLGTAPGVGFTTQTLEALGLMNNCQMFDADGKASMNSKECTDMLSEYQKMQAASVSGDQDVDSTRAAFLAGDASMMFWSTHLLDELAGYDANFPVSCEECADDPQFLAKNTKAVGLLGGPDNTTPTTYGLTMNLAITSQADTDAAKQWVEYSMSDGYTKLLSTATEGRVPLRAGTADDPEKYLNEWRALPVGADPALQAPFNEVYSDEVLAQVIEGANGFSRWGIGTDQAAVAGTLGAQNALVEDLQPLFSGTDPQAVADSFQQTVETAQQDAS